MSKKVPAYQKNPYLDPKDIEIPSLTGKIKPVTTCPHCGKVVKIRAAYNFKVTLLDVSLIAEG